MSGRKGRRQPSSPNGAGGAAHAAPPAKTLFLDIETAPNTAHVWGLFKQTIGINQLLNTGRVMCFASRWLGADETNFYSEVGSHKRMVTRAWKLLDEADIVVHYNGARFDIPTLNREFIKYGRKPPSPYQQVDLLKVARKQFRFASNRLDHLLRDLKIGEKVRHDGHELWVRCMAKDKAAWKDMERYNRGDVDQLETLYNTMLPWITNHPNMALYKSDSPSCTNCGSDKVQSRGKQHTATLMYRRFQCTNCGTWMRARSAERRTESESYTQVKYCGVTGVRMWD